MVGAISRVLSRSYRLGEKSRVTKLPRGVRGHTYTVIIIFFLFGSRGMGGSGAFFRGGGASTPQIP